MQLYTPPTHTLSFEDKINCIEFCQTTFADDLICIASCNKLILGLVMFTEDNEDQLFTLERVKDLYHETRCTAICFSPETSLTSTPKPLVTFCVAGADFILRIFRTNLLNLDTVQTLSGHTNYINDIAWDTKGEQLASVSDDFTCKIWHAESNYNNTITFCLSSDGMSVKWHPDEPHKILVAEKKGIVRFYNLQKQQAILSVETKCPLMSADWSINNRLFITAVASEDIMTWNLPRVSSPSDVKHAHKGVGQIVRFAPSSELVTASVGGPQFTLKVFTGKATTPLVEAPLKVFEGHCLCWNHRLPYVVVAEDQKLKFWKVKLK